MSKSKVCSMVIRFDGDVSGGTFEMFGGGGTFEMFDVSGAFGITSSTGSVNVPEPNISIGLKLFLLEQNRIALNSVLRCSTIASNRFLNSPANRSLLIGCV
jgi:hypothetical protein